MVEQIIVGFLDTNCYIFYDETKRGIIIDPGGNEVDIIGKVKDLGLSVSGIALTHGHFDHIAAIGKIKEYFRKKEINVKIAIHENDKGYLGSSGEKIGQDELRVLGFASSRKGVEYFTNMPEPDILFKQGDQLFDMSISVIETSGHTRGSVCFYAEKDNILFSGDTLFFRGVGRTDFPDSDGENIVNNITKKLFVLPPETTVYPGHGPSTTIESEKECFFGMIL
jgi:hydroxyacylglutathione hydrolase